MGNAIVLFIRAFGLYIALAAVAVGAFGWHKHVVADRDSWKAKAVASDKALRQANADRFASEKFRGTEFQDGKDALAAAQQTCDARVAETLRASRAIRSIVEKPSAYDANHCPIRDLVPADELRNALAPQR